MKGGPKSSLWPFLHQALQLIGVPTSSSINSSIEISSFCSFSCFFFNTKPGGKQCL